MSSLHPFLYLVIILFQTLFLIHSHFLFSFTAVYPCSRPLSPCLTYLGFIPPPFSRWVSFWRRSLEFSLCVCFLSKTPTRRKKLLFIPLCIPMRSERLNAEKTKRKERMSDGRFCFAAFCTISHGFSLDLLRFCWIKNNASGSGTVGKKQREKKSFQTRISLGQSNGNIAHQVDRGPFLRHKLPFVSSSLRKGLVIKQIRILYL